ncbi:MAG: recombinase family protein [Myxococcota bacterium]
MGRRAVCYVRVSTEEQASEGVSLDAQRAALQAYCALRQMELVEVVSDEGVSAGKSLDRRPGGQRLLELVARREVEAVVAYKLDRLFRKAAECLNVAELWQAGGVDLHFVDLGGQAVDTSSAMGKFFLTIMAGVAEMERNLIRERTRTAMQHKIKNGEFTGVAPMGWRPQEDGIKLEHNDEEQRAIERIVDLRRKGHSIRKIAAALNDEGYACRGVKWHPTTVARLLKRHATGEE